MPGNAKGPMKTALIVGGSRGIGRAVALRLARAGFDIWLTYRSDHAAAEAVRKDIEALSRRCDLAAFDVADHEATKAALEPLLARGAPEVMVFCAGIARDNLLVWMTRKEWDDVVSTDLGGFYNVTRPVVFHMLKEGRGRIVIVSSVSGVIGQAGQVNYSAAKAGLIGAVKALAREVGRRGVLVNAVAPGVVQTDMTGHLDTKQVLPLIPLRRLGTPEDVASVIGFLCTDPDMYIHGQVIGIDGGLSM